MIAVKIDQATLDTGLANWTIIEENLSAYTHSIIADTGRAVVAQVRAGLPTTLEDATILAVASAMLKSMRNLNNAA